MTQLKVNRFYYFAFLFAIFSFEPQIAFAETISDPPNQLSVSKNIKKPRVALVLGGGGLRGFAHIGVLKVLQRENIPIDMVIGTSIGALIGGLYCAGINPDELYQVGTERLIHAYYSSPVLFQTIRLPLDFLCLKPPQGLYKGNVLAKVINQVVGPDKQDIENLSPKFAAVATDLIDAESYTIAKGNLGKALQASAAIPLVRKPVKLDGKLLVDGGVISNIPVKEAQELGADFIIAVDVDERLLHIDARQFQTKMGLIPSRILGLILVKEDEGQWQNADIFIHPKVCNISLLSKKVSDAKLAAEAGESAANEMVPQIKAKLSQYGLQSYNSN